jgi:hypothetical protein
VLEVTLMHVRGEPHRVGDLISYQNDGKSCTTIAGKVERA